MPSSEKRTVELPVEQARFIDALVAAGTYATSNDVISAGLRALRTQEEEVEHWLRAEVVPVYDATQADPTRLIPAERVIAELHAHHAAQLKARRGA